MWADQDKWHKRILKFVADEFLDDVNERLAELVKGAKPLSAKAFRDRLHVVQIISSAYEEGFDVTLAGDGLFENDETGVMVMCSLKEGLISVEEVDLSED